MKWSILFLFATVLVLVIADDKLHKIDLKKPGNYNLVYKLVTRGKQNDPKTAPLIEAKKAAKISLNFLERSLTIERAYYKDINLIYRQYNTMVALNYGMAKLPPVRLDIFFVCSKTFCQFQKVNTAV